MIIYASIQDLKKGEPGKVYQNYDELLKDITPGITDHFYRCVEIHTEEELEKFKAEIPPGFDDYAPTEEQKKLHGFNQITPYDREVIPSGWKKIRWVVGTYFERHITSSPRFEKHIANHWPVEWSEKRWNVVGVIACNWEGKL